MITLANGLLSIKMVGHPHDFGPMTDLKKKLSDDLLAKAQNSGKGSSPTKQVVPEGFTSLGASFEIDDYVHKKVKWMAEHKDFGGMAMPRFGLMSLMLATTPIHAYDNPVMNKICRTGFTDGIRVFMHTSMLEKIWDEEEESKGTIKGFIPFSMHEMIHKMRRHPERHARLDPVLRNIAEDLNIQATIIESFPEIEWPVCLRETGVGFGPGESAKYITMSEEAIYFELLQKRSKELKPPPGQGKGKGSDGPGNSPGQGGGPSSRNNSPGQPGEGGDGDPTDGEAGDQFGAPGDMHTITPEELIKALEEGGMDETMRRLNMPASSDKEAIETLKNLSDMGRVEAINKAYRQMKDAEEKGHQYPGSQMVHAAAEMLTTQAKPKMTYKLAMRDLCIQSGTKDVYVEDDEPDDIYYVESVTAMMGGNPVYQGVNIPMKQECAVLVIFDASGSVDNANFKEGLAEVFGLKKTANNFGDTATEVIVVMGDTELTEGVQILNEDNYEKVIRDGIAREAFGGTDLTKVINQALDLGVFKDKKIQGVIMFTDSFDTPPKRYNINLPDGTAFVFAVFSTTGTGDVEKFAAGTADWARTVQVDDGVEVDLSNTFMDTMDASPAQQRRRPRMN